MKYLNLTMFVFIWAAFLFPSNSVLKASDEDRKTVTPHPLAEIFESVAGVENCNNSDIDFGEYKGKLVINYSWVNQTGEEFLAEAAYNGTMKQFLKGWFSIKK